MSKILYVCPCAHYSGHHPHVSMIEPYALSHNNKVDLLTFEGIIDGQKAKVNEHNVIKNKAFKLLLNKLRQYTFLRWFLMLTEMYLTLEKAVNIYKKGKYDVIQLRDGDPFLFIPFLVGLYHHNINWLISVTGSVIYAPRQTSKSISAWVYTRALHFIQGEFWHPIYKEAMFNNRYLLLAQNEKSMRGFQYYCKRIFDGKVLLNQRGVELPEVIPTKQEARQYLNLKQDALIVLSFGAPHQGKNMRVIFEAIANDKEIHLLHGGKHTYSLGASPLKLAEEFNLNGRCHINCDFIAEADKPFYFAAADVAVLSYTKVFASTASMLGEAARFGLPVIASDNHMLGEDVHRYNLGLTFQAENSQDLIQAIKKFKQLDSAILRDMKVACKKYALSHSIVGWAKECDRIYEIYR